jgi:dTDP-4-dehydrorhamnose reductase
MRILLLGKNGQLGWEFQRTLAPLGELIALDWPEVDFSKPETLQDLVRRIQPQVIINAAAYTAVDRAETEYEICRAINAAAPEVLADEARHQRAALIHYSTDYVFDGHKGAAYIEEDAPAPLNTYGVTKFEGEQNVQKVGDAYWIFRTSWVYSSRRDSFVSKVLEWARKNKTLKIVSDQVGGPTWCRMLAEISTLALVNGRQDPYEWVKQTTGLYHLAGSGLASRLEWAQEILKHDPHPGEQLVEEMIAAETSEFPTPALRPLYTPMNCTKFEQTFHLSLPHWKAALKLMMEG